MKPEFKKNMSRNYMVFPVNQEKRDYQLKMVCVNEIKGLLKTEKTEMNGEEQLYYDITSKQPLTVIYGNKDIDYDSLRSIFLSMCIMYSESRRYLLDVGNCVFNPEYIFVNPETKEVEWAFCPGFGDGNLAPLAEFILEHVDHGNPGAVESAFRFYKCAKNDSFIPGEMLDFIDRMGETDRDEKRVATKEDYFPAGLLTADGAISVAEPPKKELPKILHENTGLYEEGELPEKKNKIRDIIDRLFSKKDDEGVKFVSEYQNESDVTDFEEYADFEEDFGETIMLKPDLSEKRILRGTGRNSKDISLEKLPAVLGKMKGNVDIVLPGNGVSRIHARIFEESGNLFLQDMNSKNGTFKNGLELGVNETVEINPGDEITFADVSYTYI